MPEGSITNVTEHQAGSELAADVLAGVQTIVVEDIDELDADGGVVTIGANNYGYTVPEDSEGPVDLLTPLLDPASAGDPVMLYPPLIERYAWVQDTDQEEELQALIPHALIELLPLGARNGDGEQVEVDYRGEDLVIVDVLGLLPTRDGSTIDPDTLPPPTGSDGLVPAISPVPTVRGGIGALVVEWTPIANPDPVSYEVHVSTSSGFNPGVATYATETEGALVFLRTLPGGVPLQYETTYYVKVVAKDVDGADDGPFTEASGQMVQVTGDDIAVHSILAENILAGTITTEELAAVLILTKLIQAPAAEGQRIEIGAKEGWVGIRLIAQDGSTLVELPANPGASASFTGSLTAEDLTVLNKLLIQGGNNYLDAGATFTVSSQLADPVSPPVVEVSNDGITLESLPAYQAGDHVTHRGLFYDSSGPSLLTALVSEGSILVWEHALDGSVAHLPVEIPPKLVEASGINQQVMPWNRVCGITRRGGIIYVLGWRGAQQLVVTRIDQASFAVINDKVITAPQQKDPYRSTISAIGSSIFIWSFTGTTEFENLRRDEYTDTDPDTWAHVGAQTYSDLAFDGRAGGVVLEGHVRAEGKDWIAHSKAGVHGANSFNITTFAVESETGFVSGAQGIAYDTVNTRFLSRSGGRVNLHTDWDWTHTDKFLVYSYSWRDSVADDNTKPSPQKALDVRPDGNANRAYRRSRIKVTLPDFPTGITRFRLFQGRKNDPNTLVANADMHLQAVTVNITTQTASPTYHFLEDPAGIVPAVANDFPGANSAIRSATPLGSGGWDLTGTGHSGFTSTSISCVATFTGTLTIPNNVMTLVGLTSERVDTTGSMHSNATNPSRITAPSTGKYLVYAKASWASSGGGYRHIQIVKNVGQTIISESTVNPVTPTRAIHQAGPTEVLLNANDYIEMLAFQNSGVAGGLNINTQTGVELG